MRKKDLHVSLWKEPGSCQDWKLQYPCREAPSCSTWKSLNPAVNRFLLWNLPIPSSREQKCLSFREKCYNLKLLASPGLLILNVWTPVTKPIKHYPVWKLRAHKAQAERSSELLIQSYLRGVQPFAARYPIVKFRWQPGGLFQSPQRWALNQVCSCK